jgi:hypothetical protein
MFQAGMGTQNRRNRKVEPARAQVGSDGRSLGRLRRLPDRQRRRATLKSLGVGFLGKPAPMIEGDA